ncbi:MAG TPA: hypothetical protein DEF51_08980 [Myxococcales bacterium]|nr:hypothetical protein [Myxococcales bacterium]
MASRNIAAAWASPRASAILASSDLAFARSASAAVRMTRSAASAPSRSPAARRRRASSRAECSASGGARAKRQRWLAWPSTRSERPRAPSGGLTTIRRPPATRSERMATGAPSTVTATGASSRSGHQSVSAASASTWHVGPRETSTQPAKATPSSRRLPSGAPLGTSRSALAASAWTARSFMGRTTRSRS